MEGAVVHELRHWFTVASEEQLHLLRGEVVREWERPEEHGLRDLAAAARDRDGGRIRAVKILRSGGVFGVGDTDAWADVAARQ